MLLLIHRNKVQVGPGKISPLFHSIISLNLIHPYEFQLCDTNNNITVCHPLRHIAMTLSAARRHHHHGLSSQQRSSQRHTLKFVYQTKCKKIIKINKPSMEKIKLGNFISFRQYFFPFFKFPAVRQVFFISFDYACFFSFIFL